MNRYYECLEYSIAGRLVAEKNYPHILSNSRYSILYAWVLHVISSCNSYTCNFFLDEKFIQIAVKKTHKTLSSFQWIWQITWLNSTHTHPPRPTKIGAFEVKRSWKYFSRIWSQVPKSQFFCFCFSPTTEHIIGTKIRARACVHCSDLGVNDATYCSRNTQWNVSACKGRKDAVQCSILLRLKTTRMPQVRKNYMWCKLVFQARICSNQTANESQDGCSLPSLVEYLASKTLAREGNKQGEM